MPYSHLLAGRTAAVGGLLLVTLTAGCSDGTEGSSSPVVVSTSPSSSASPSTGSGSLVPATTLDTKKNFPALGRLEDVRVIKAAQGDKTYAHVLDIASDGSALMSVGPRDYVSNGVIKLRTRRLELWTADGEKSVISDGVSTRTGGPVSQTVSADLCGGVPVWAETTSTEVATPDWKVWARPKGSTKPVLLGQSEQFVGASQSAPDPAGPFTVTTDGTTAYWPAVRKLKGQGAGSGWQSMILGAALSGGRKLEVVAQDGMMPAAVPGGLLYITEPRLSDKVEAGHYQIRMVQGGVDSLALEQDLPTGAKVIGFTATDELMVVNVRYPTSAVDQQEGVYASVLTVWRKGEAEPVTVRLHGDGASELHAAGNLVAWGNGSGSGEPGMYVLDLQNSTVNKVEELDGASNINLCGNEVSWSVPGRTTVLGTGFGFWQ